MRLDFDVNIAKGKSIQVLYNQTSGRMYFDSYPIMPISTASLSRFIVSSLLLNYAKLYLIMLYIERQVRLLKAKIFPSFTLVNFQRTLLRQNESYGQNNCWLRDAGRARDNKELTDVIIVAAALPETSSSVI